MNISEDQRGKGTQTIRRHCRLMLLAILGSLQAWGFLARTGNEVLSLTQEKHWDKIPAQSWHTQRDPSFKGWTRKKISPPTWRIRNLSVSICFGGGKIKSFPRLCSHGPTLMQVSGSKKHYHVVQIPPSWEADADVTLRLIIPGVPGRDKHKTI